MLEILALAVAAIALLAGAFTIVLVIGLIIRELHTQRMTRIAGDMARNLAQLEAELEVERFIRNLR